MQKIFLFNASAAIQGLNARILVVYTKQAKPKKSNILLESPEYLMSCKGQTLIKELK